MSREIKFRAWHIKEKKWFGLFLIDQSGDLYQDGDSFPKEDYVLEQYTGQEDLCEHDIIEITKENDTDHGFYLPVGNKYVIVWDDMHCGFCLASPETFKYNNENDISQRDLEYYGLLSENLEMPITVYSKLIGNIREK